MTKRQTMLIILAILLVGLALWANLGGTTPEYHPPVMTAAELAGLKPDQDGDIRLLEELRRRCGDGPQAWRDLPEPARIVFATLWAEEVHRTTSWPARTMEDAGGNGVPTLAEAADAYQALGNAEVAKAVRALTGPYEQACQANRAWLATLKEGKTPSARPSLKTFETAANIAFNRALAIRTQRLAYLREHARDLDIR